MKQRRDQRFAGVTITIVAVALLGGLITLLPGPQPQLVETPLSPAIADGNSHPNQHARDARSREIGLRFQQAIAMLHARQFDYAVKALHRVLELSPRMVEAHVNMGYALIGLEDYKGARDFFFSATELRPGQVNAYYGMAVAMEEMGELEGAVGAMRTFVHLSSKGDPFIAKARAALWEWQDRLAKLKQKGGEKSGSNHLADEVS